MPDATLTIYPTARKVEDQWVRLSGGGCALGDRLTTLPQLINAIWRESADQRMPLDVSGERLALREAIAAQTDGERERIKPGMADRVLGLIRQLKSAGLGPEDWRAAYDQLDNAGRLRLRQFTNLFASYQEQLAKSGAADHHDREMAALHLLHRSEQEGSRPACLSDIEHLVIAEIYDLSLVQFMILAALIRLIGDAELTIQAEPFRIDASRFAELTLGRFVSEQSIADQVLPNFVRRGGRTGRLGFVLENLFSRNQAAPPAPDDTVRIIVAPTARAEAEQTAQMIAGLIGQRPQKIGILARDPESYREFLTSAFRRHGIANAIGGGRPLTTEMPARVVLELLRIPQEGYRREALIGLCESAVMSFAAENFRWLPVEVGYIDRATRSLAECIELRRAELRRAIALEKSEGAKSKLQRRLTVLEDAGGAWAELLDALDELKGEATLTAHLERLRALLRRLRFDPAARSMSDGAAHASGPISRALDELAVAAERVMPDRELSLAEFTEIIERAFAEATIEESDGRSGLRVLSVLDARGLDFDRVFVLGLNDGVFPRYHPEDPLLPSATLPQLNRALRDRLKGRFGGRTPDAPGPILRSPGDRNSEEPFLFFLALSMPSEAVVLSCAREDDDGHPLAPSPFLEEIRALLGAPEATSAWAADAGETGERSRQSDQKADGTEMDAGERARVGWIRERIAIERHREEYLQLPTRAELFKERRGDSDEWLEAQWPAPDATKDRLAASCDGRTGSSPALRKFLLEGSGAGAYRWSATRLNDLASCGFKFLAARILRLRRDEAGENEINALETGTLAHRILRDFFDAKPNFRDREGTLKLLEGVLAEWRIRQRGQARDVAFFDLEWRTIAAMMKEIAEYELARDPAVERPDTIETEFLLEFALTGAIGNAPEQVRIELQGYIDRLEIFRAVAKKIDRLRVIDYKISRSRKKYKELLEPRNFCATDLQMGLYALGAVQHFDNQLGPNTRIEAVYLALRDRDKETESLTIPLDRLKDAGDPVSVAGRVRTLIGEAAAGRFDVDPLECNEFCAYRRVCRIGKRSA